jgi:hypothetical protein
MILRGIVELQNEKLYFGRTTSFNEPGFIWIVSDTPYPNLGFTVTTREKTGLRGAIKLFLQPDYGGSFDQRKKDIERKAEKIKNNKDLYPNFKIPNELYEKYNIHS